MATVEHARGASEGCNGDYTLAKSNQTRYNAGYAGHDFECPIVKMAPHGDFCIGYDKALQYMMSNH